MALLLKLALVSSLVCSAVASSYVGYLISTFTDLNPTVQWYLSKGNDPSTYSFLNKGKAILTSTVGTKAVRDVYLAKNTARSQWFMLGTDLDVEVSGFSWDSVMRHGSRSIVVWSSTNLVDWSAPRLPVVEAATAGMVWAPTAVYDDATSLYYVFWASCFYNSTDTGHTGTRSLNRIRYASTKDFVTFSAPADYINFPSNSVIDIEFLYLGSPGHYARFFKDETAGSHVPIEFSTTGLFGTWTRLGNVRPEGSREGPASFEDNTTPGKYYLFLDNYTEYLPFYTTNISAIPWSIPSWPNFPSGLKHGSVTPLTQAEYNAVAAKYPA